jgi:DNA polymerase-3 subunit delta
MKLSPTTLPIELKKRLLHCYLISGDEPLLVQESLDLLRQSSFDAGFTVREVYDQSQSIDWQEILSASNNLSLFSEKKLIEIRLTSAKPGREGIKSIIELTQRLNEDLMLVISAPKIDKATLASKWCQFFQIEGGFVQIWPLKANELPVWLERRMMAVGLTAEKEAVLMLAHRVEGNLLAASQAIEKLKLYLGEGNVSETDMQKVVSDDSRYDVYKLIDALLIGDIKLGLRILSSLQSESMDAVVVIWALNRELRLLSKLAFSLESGMNTNEVMRSYRIWTSRQNIVSACLNRHQAKDFHSMIKACTNADNAAKGQTKDDKWQLIRNIIFSLSTYNKAA